MFSEYSFVFNIDGTLYHIKKYRGLQKPYTISK